MADELEQPLPIVAVKKLGDIASHDLGDPQTAAEDQPYGQGGEQGKLAIGSGSHEAGHQGGKEKGIEDVGAALEQ